MVETFAGYRRILSTLECSFDCQPYYLCTVYLLGMHKAKRMEKFSNAIAPLQIFEYLCINTV